MEDVSSTDKDWELWILLIQVRDAIGAARRKELLSYHITAGQSAGLFAIKAIGDKATPAEVGRWLFRQSHSTSDLMGRMERAGLVRKVKDLERKNMVRLVLTEKGREAYHQSAKRESIHEIMSSLSQEEHQQLRSALQTLRDKALKELGIVRKMPFPPSE